MRDSKKHGARAAAICASLVSLAVLACSSSSPRPAELGNCTPVGDASCAITTGSSGAGPMDGGSSSDGGVVSDDGGGCGSNLVSTQNTTCAPCVQSSCCQANADCAGDGTCGTLVGCTQACATTDPGCVATCFNSASPAGQKDYGDLSMCLSGSCPGCPVLPLNGTPDL